VGKLIKPLTPHEIYEKLRAGDTRLLEEGRTAAQAQAVTEGVRATLLGRQAALLQTGWEGAASGGAAGVVRSLVDNAQVGTDQLVAAQRLMDQQSGSFHHAANSVRPVPAEPPKPDFTDMNWPFVDYEKQVTGYQADAQHNIEVFRGYDNASEDHESGMKPYTVVDDSGGTVTVTDTGDYIEVPDGGQQPLRDGDRSGPFGERHDPGSGPGGGPGGAPAGGPGAGFQQSQQTSPSDFVPRSSGPFPGQPPGQAPGGGSPTGGYVSGFPVGGVSGGSYRVGPETGGPGSGGRGPAMRGGLPGALAAEEAAAQRAAAAGSRGGSGVMGAAPVGSRGKGDEEHVREILIESDAESLFGSDVLTAPQVIGDDEYEDD
jgi:hypothetical protein